MTVRILSLLLVAMLATPTAPKLICAGEIDIVRPIGQLVGEEHLYSVDFLIFRKLAAGELRLSRTGQANIFRAELIGRALGVAAWLTGNRIQTYSSLMELCDDGSLRSVEYVAKIDRMKHGRMQSHGRHQIYDYEHGKVIDEKIKDGKFKSRKVRQIPDGERPVDMLTAFCNLRTGVYGPLVRGAGFSIPTYSSRGFAEIEVRVLTSEQQSASGRFPANGLLVQAIVDPDIFDNDKGNLYIWFNDAGIPERGVIENMIGMGDVIGYLDREGI